MTFLPSFTEDTTTLSEATRQAEEARALYHQASRLRLQGRRTDAVPLYRQALTLWPDFAACLNDYGFFLLTQKQFPQALDCLQRALHLEPTNPVILRNLGCALVTMDDFPAGLSALHRAVQRQNTSVETVYALAWGCYEAGLFDRSWEWLSRALRLNSKHARAHFLRAEILLSGGDYHAGWQEFEWRLQAHHTQSALLSAPRWQGETLERKTLLVFSDEGYGDCLQFARFLPLIAPRFGGRIVFLVPPELARLLNGNVKCDVLTTTLALAAVDYAVPLLSLPLMLGVTAADIPTDGPYIQPSALARHWKDRLAQYQGLRVGLCWSGSFQNSNDHRRSCKLADFAPLANVQGCVFFSLQKGTPAARVRQPPPGLTLIDFTDELHDFADTASLIAALDLVISVDTSVCHLAGAMGKPTWILLSRVPSWRWGLEGESTPWYTTARLFRQPRHGDWDAVMVSVAEELRACVQRGAIRGRCKRHSRQSGGDPGVLTPARGQS